MDRRRFLTLAAGSAVALPLIGRVPATFAARRDDDASAAVRGVGVPATITTIDGEPYATLTVDEFHIEWMDTSGEPAEYVDYRIMVADITIEAIGDVDVPIDSIEFMLQSTQGFWSTSAIASDLEETNYPRMEDEGNDPIPAGESAQFSCVFAARVNQAYGRLYWRPEDAGLLSVDMIEELDEGMDLERSFGFPGETEITATTPEGEDGAVWSLEAFEEADDIDLTIDGVDDPVFMRLTVEIENLYDVDMPVRADSISVRDRNGIVRSGLPYDEKTEEVEYGLEYTIPAGESEEISVIIALEDGVDPLEVFWGQSDIDTPLGWSTIDLTESDDSGNDDDDDDDISATPSADDDDKDEDDKEEEDDDTNDDDDDDAESTPAS